MLELSLAPREEQVSIDGKTYTVREVTEAGSIAYRATMTRGSTVEDKKASMGDGMAESEAVLVSYCLCDDKGAPVHIDIIKDWPRRVVKALFDLAEKLGEEPTKEEVKN